MCIVKLKSKNDSGSVVLHLISMSRSTFRSHMLIADWLTDWLVGCIENGSAYTDPHPIEWERGGKSCNRLPNNIYIFLKFLTFSRSIWHGWIETKIKQQQQKQQHGGKRKTPHEFIAWSNISWIYRKRKHVLYVFVFKQLKMKAKPMSWSEYSIRVLVCDVCV